LMLPFLESWVTGDKREHHLLQRPRNAPTRTGTMVALMTFYGLMWAAGGNDIIAITLHASINQITYFMRGAVFIGPVVAFFITRRWCISLQRHDEGVLLHGYESGIIMRSPEGGYSERHLPISGARAYVMTARDREEVPTAEAPETDENGVPRKRSPLESIRNKARTLMYADNIQKPTVEELEEARHHAEHEHELTAALDGQAADGHQFDGIHAVESETLRGDH
jgi:ubiquinol-cytochrome c reductase cytochrome b subunit